MKTNVQRTSIESYDALKVSGFKGQHAAILSHMTRGRIYSRRQLAKLSGLETSTMAARCHELVESKQVVVCGTIRCPITQVHVQGVKLAESQLELVS